MWYSSCLGFDLNGWMDANIGFQCLQFVVNRKLLPWHQQLFPFPLFKEFSSTNLSIHGPDHISVCFLFAESSLIGLFLYFVIIFTSVLWAALKQSPVSPKLSSINSTSAGLAGIRSWYQGCCSPPTPSLKSQLCLCAGDMCCTVVCSVLWKSKATSLSFLWHPCLFTICSPGWIFWQRTAAHVFTAVS